MTDLRVGWRECSGVRGAELGHALCATRLSASISTTWHRVAEHASVCGAQVTSADAMAMARRLAKEEGVLCGISSGAAIKAAIEIGSRSPPPPPPRTHRAPPCCSLLACPPCPGAVRARTDQRSTSGGGGEKGEWSRREWAARSAGPGSCGRR
eukprot:1968476-Rhodomonas_salina.7